MNWIRVIVTAAPGRRGRGRLRDELPARLDPHPTSWPLLIPGTVEYSVIPEARGDEHLGGVVVRAVGPWGLGFRQSTIAIPETVAVEPDLTAVRLYDALARRGQLAELGVRSVRRPGEGGEFERIREAVPDDPLRLVNWKATAKTGRLMATAMVPERAQPVVICIDHGRLMGVGSEGMTKLDHAINAALLLVHVALSSGDRVGLFAFADTVTSTVPPRTGRAQMRRFLDGVRPLRAGEIESDYEAALIHLSRWQTKRALLCIFTDVLDIEQSASLTAQCRHLARHHVPLVITVRDPALVDAARAAPTDGASMYARAVAGGLSADRDDALRLLRHRGVETMDADARTLSPKLVNRYLELKRRSRI